MANVLSHDRRKLALRLLCEGMSIRATCRVTKIDKEAVMRLILQFGQACARFLDDNLRGLTLDHLECDEIWSYVAKKQSRLTIDEKAERHDIGDVYLWTAVDRTTKLITSYHVGKRSADNARRFMLDLASRLVFPAPGAGDAHGFQPAQQIYITQISTDGFSPYPEAVDLAFGGKARFGTIIKDYKNATMLYTPSEMIGTKRTIYRGIPESQIRTICTSHVERNNGTIRTFMRRFSRLTYCFSKKLENHEAAISMFVAYYNFVWRTRYPDKSGKPGKLRPTAAMMAKIVPDLWTFDRLYDEVIMYG